MTTSGCPIGGPRCPRSICDCFIEEFPDDPLGLHPELFMVMVRCANCGYDGGLVGGKCPECETP